MIDAIKANNKITIIRERKISIILVLSIFSNIRKYIFDRINKDKKFKEMESKFI
jgi:hypothetical protein